MLTICSPVQIFFAVSFPSVCKFSHIPHLFGVLAGSLDPGTCMGFIQNMSRCSSNKDVPFTIMILKLYIKIPFPFSRKLYLCIYSPPFGGSCWLTRPRNLYGFYTKYVKSCSSNKDVPFTIMILKFYIKIPFPFSGKLAFIWYFCVKLKSFYAECSCYYQSVISYCTVQPEVVI